MLTQTAVVSPKDVLNFKLKLPLNKEIPHFHFYSHNGIFLQCGMPASSVSRKWHLIARVVGSIWRCAPICIHSSHFLSQEASRVSCRKWLQHTGSWDLFYSGKIAILSPPDSGSNGHACHLGTHTAMSSCTQAHASQNWCTWHHYILQHHKLLPTWHPNPQVHHWYQSSRFSWNPH